MRQARRLIAILIGCVTSFIATSTVAYATVAADPYGRSVVAPPALPAAAETSLWRFVSTATLGLLLAAGAVGLIASLRGLTERGAVRQAGPITEAGPLTAAGAVAAARAVTKAADVTKVADVTASLTHAGTWGPRGYTVPPSRLQRCPSV